jgi:hypothetical protein
MLSLLQPVDFEDIQSYTLSISVKDLGKLSSSALAMVYILDINEAPKFIGNTPVIKRVDEDGYGLPKISKRLLSGGKIRAEDADAEERISYKFINDRGDYGLQLFSITLDGAIYTQETAFIDFEERQSYNLWVIAEDSGGLSATTEVMILINDLNEPPNFYTSVFGVGENFNEGQFVGQISANDTDLGNSQQLSYQILAGNVCRRGITRASCQQDTFKVTPDGEIRVNVDHDSTSITNEYLVAEEKYELEIEVSDDGIPARSTIGFILIEVFEQNEPPILQNLEVSVSEHTPLSIMTDVQVGRVIGYDPDGDVLEYAIVGGNLGNAFRIHKGTADIHVKTEDALDYETRGEWLLLIQATDSGKGNLTAVCEVKINLVDINERPNLSKEMLQVEENSDIGTDIGAPMKVMDVDNGFFGECIFRIKFGNENGYFRINKQTGQISISRRYVNYEVSSLHQLIVEVRDKKGSGLDAEATVSIKIVDLNDMPVILSQIRQISENSEVNQLVGTVLKFSDEDAMDSHSFAIRKPNCWQHTSDGDSVPYVLKRIVTNPQDLFITAKVSGTANAKFLFLNDPATIQNRYEVVIARNGDSIVEFVQVLDGTETNICVINNVHILTDSISKQIWINIKNGLLQIGLGNTQSKSTRIGSCSSRCTGATVFENADYNKEYKGWSEHLVIGKIPNTVSGISSIRFGGHCTATLFERVDLSGSFKILSEDVPSLSTLGWNDATKSIDIDHLYPVIEVKHIALMAFDGKTIQFDDVCYHATLSQGRNANSNLLATPATADNIFMITKSNGQIIVLSSNIDFETTSQYGLLIEVTDTGIPNLAASAVIHIDVKNVNEAPVIVVGTGCGAGYTACFSIKENSERGAYVGRLTGKDQDQGDFY